MVERGGVARMKVTDERNPRRLLLECVGTQESMLQTIEVRPGGYVSYVGGSHGIQLDGQQLFFSHVMGTGWFAAMRPM